MLIYSHKDLDAYSNKHVFGSRICKVPLIWCGLGWPQVDLLIRLLPAVGCLGSSILAESVHLSGVGWLSADLGWPRLRWLGWLSTPAEVAPSSRKAQTYSHGRCWEVRPTKWKYAGSWSTVDPWTTWSLRALTFCAVENPSITYGWPSLYTGPFCLQILHIHGSIFTDSTNQPTHSKY